MSLPREDRLTTAMLLDREQSVTDCEGANRKSEVLAVNILIHRPCLTAAIFGHLWRPQSIHARPATSAGLPNCPSSSRCATISGIPRSGEIQRRRIRHSAARLRLLLRTGSSRGWARRGGQESDGVNLRHDAASVVGGSPRFSVTD
jgi:hypothetical protein